MESFSSLRNITNRLSILNWHQNLTKLSNNYGGNHGSHFNLISIGTYFSSSSKNNRLSFRQFCKNVKNKKEEKEEEVDEPPTIKIEIPRSKMTLSYSRSSGPGGQNVNKLNTKAELRFSINDANWIPKDYDIRKRFIEQNANRITSAGEFVITSERSRLQLQNANDCFDKLQKLLDTACIIPIERKETEVPDYAVEGRKKEKKFQSQKKKDRNWKNERW